MKKTHSHWLIICLVNAVWIPCLLLFLVSFHIESPLLSLVALALMFVLPALVYIALQRRLRLGPALPFRVVQRQLNIIAGFTRFRHALVCGGVCAAIFVCACFLGGLDWPIEDEKTSGFCVGWAFVAFVIISGAVWLSGHIMAAIIKIIVTRRGSRTTSE